MHEAPTSPVLPTGMPEGWALDRDLLCPTCGYNLRMLRVPRCPECGLVFRWQMLLRVFCPRCGEPLFTTDDAECPRCKLHLDWPGLLEGARVQDRRLFEYGDQPVRSALGTWVRALNPWRFWQSIRLESPPVVRRLVWLRRVALGMCLLGVGLMMWLQWSALGVTTRAPALATDALPLFPLVLVLPLVTRMGLPLFTPTLAHFRIRRDQLLRCFAYAGSGWLWIGLCCVAGSLAGLIINTFWPRAPWFWGVGRTWVPRVWFEPGVVFRAVRPGGWSAAADAWVVWFSSGVMGVVVLFSFVWWWAFLYVSLRRHLRLDRSNALALLVSTQAIGLLLLLLVLVCLSFLLGDIGMLVLWLRPLFE